MVTLGTSLNIISRESRCKILCAKFYKPCKNVLGKILTMLLTLLFLGGRIVTYFSSYFVSTFPIFSTVLRNVNIFGRRKIKVIRIK